MPRITESDAARYLEGLNFVRTHHEASETGDAAEELLTALEQGRRDFEEGQIDFMRRGRSEFEQSSS